MPWTRTFDRDNVLEQAMLQFWAYGFAATSLHDLENATALKRGSIYHTFGDKRALFITALRHYDIHFRQSKLQSLERLSDPLAAIRGIFEFWIARSQQDVLQRGCFLTNTALELAPHDAEIGALVARSQRELEAFFCRLLCVARAKRVVDHDLDPATAAPSLLASLVGLLVLARSRPEPELLSAIEDNALAALALPLEPSRS